MVLIPTFASEMSGVLSKLLDEQFLPLVAWHENEFRKNDKFCNSIGYFNMASNDPRIFLGECRENVL